MLGFLEQEWALLLYSNSKKKEGKKKMLRKRGPSLQEQQNKNATEFCLQRKERCW